MNDIPQHQNPLNDPHPNLDEGAHPAHQPSIVRRNLMSREGYAPYCGDATCRFRMPRTRFDGQQFGCLCGWRSNFPAEFITEYKSKWGIL